MNIHASNIDLHMIIVKDGITSISGKVFYSGVGERSCQPDFPAVRRYRPLSPTANFREHLNTCQLSVHSAAGSCSGSW